MKKTIVDEVKDFILGAIPTVSYLEAILLMRSLPEHYWSIAELSQRLFISEQIAEGITKQLQLSGIINALDSTSNTYHYQPTNEKLTALINQLAETYTTNLVEITNLIHSKNEKAASKFSNAFIWRKDK